MSQPTLPGIEKPSRPKVTKKMILEAAESFMAEHNKDNSFGVNAKELVSEYTHPMDGYEIAMELNRNHYDIDRDEMERLDEFSGMVDDLLDKAEKQWVIDNDIEPPFALGAKVHVKYGRKTVSGVLDHLCTHSVACYAVKEDGCTQDGRYMIIKFEDVVGVAECEKDCLSRDGASGE